MKKNFCRLLLIFSIWLGTEQIAAQAIEPDRNPWVMGFGFNIIYDSGEGLEGIFDFKNNYNYDIPLRFSIEKRFLNNYGIELSANFNRLLKDKRINNTRLSDDINVFAIDAMYKYYFTNLFLDTYRSSFEGFLSSGASANFYNGKGGMTANLGLGLNYFITERFWLTGQGITKFAVVNADLGSNYLQFNLGFIIRLGQ